MRVVVGLLLTLVLCDAAAADPKLLFEVKGLEQPESVVYGPRPPATKP